MLDTAFDGSAARFFEHELVRVVLQAPARFAALAGILAIKVKDQGAWTVRFGDLDQPVVAGFDRCAGSKLWLMRDGFARFLAGSLDGRDKKRVLARGDLELIARFGRLLTINNTSAVSIRFQR